MRTIKETVSQLTKKYGTNDPFEIASRKNILVLFEQLGSTLGYFNTYKRIRMIHINRDSTEAEQKYTCAHELGHVILHPTVNTPFLSKHTLFSIDKIEREANEFAVELLMPDEWVYENRNTAMTIYEAAAVYGIPPEVAHLKKL
ncbi:ImmA/IrrE family metallo-endopeptidase [Brevibacillus massiliensis]|jgi:Zn-dependent peptidase ImmA (M78 family)|uniref:ImmA/IrrE family metallo-endopeptidase n=1 Tax=Brevibacillus massiliensis TaxID=1118054 RepID=UPI0002F1496A|nr:ImmA/IrrE family metallo-endopeptidase [Brevibacillus massiliensis]